MGKRKAVFITGVLGGIGSVLAQAFKVAGFRVYGSDVSDDTIKGCDYFFQFDLSQYVVDEVYKKTWDEKFDQKIGGLDVLINNAAVQLLDNLDDIKLADWQRTINVNLTGPMLLSQFFLSRLEERNGSIINIGSIHQELTKPRFVSYATSKSAIVGLTKALAVDLAGRVRINAISPAAIETSMLIEGFDGNKKALDELRKLHPVQRIGYPNDVARLALFLASENTGFIHGANLHLDGGIRGVLKDL